MIKNRIYFVFLLCFAVFVLPISGDGRLGVASAVADETTAEQIDLRILIDISEQSKSAFDELELIHALQQLLERLPDNSRAGVWSYGKYVNHTVSHQRVTAGWRKKASQQLLRIKPVALHRNIPAVMRKASFDLSRVAYHQRHILLLSAGPINLYSGAHANALERHELLNKQLPGLRRSGYVIHTLALSEQADQAMLTTLAKETGGLSLVAHDQQSLLQAMLMMSQRLAPQNHIPIERNQLVIDSGVTGFSGLFIGPEENQQQYLQSPDGGIVEWQAASGYTPKQIEKPAAGLWQLPTAINSLSRIYIEAEPEIAVDKLQPTYVVGERPVFTMLSPAPDQLANRDVIVSLWQGDGELYRQALQNAETRLPSFTAPGQYWLRVEQKTLEYHRAVDYPVQVYPLLGMAVTTEQEGDQRHFVITLTSEDEDLVISKSQLSATITNTADEQQVRVINQNNEQQWQMTLVDDGKSTEYQVQLEFEGITKTGREIYFKPKPLLIELRAPEIVEQDITPVAEAESPPAQSLEKASLPVAKDKQGGRVWWLIIMATGVLGGIALLGVYFLMNKKSKSSQVEEIKEPESQSEPEPEPVAAHEELLKNEEEADELEIDIDLDDVFDDETVLAEEWREIDASATTEEQVETKSEPEPEPEDDFDSSRIEEDFNQLDSELGLKGDSESKGSQQKTNKSDTENSSGDEKK